MKKITRTITLSMLMAVLTACGSPSNSPGTSEAPAGTAGEGVTRVVIVVGQDAEVHEGDLVKILNAVSQAKGEVTIVPASGAPPTTVRLEGKGPNALQRKEDLRRRTQEARTSFTTAAKAVAATPSLTTIFTSVSAVLNTQATTKEPAHVVLFTPTVAPDDIPSGRQVAMQVLPCTQWFVYAAIVPAASDPTNLGARERTQTFIHQCGGHLVTWGYLKEFPRTQEIPTPTPHPTPTGTTIPINLTLPSDILFDVDQASLRPEATPQLEQLLKALRSGGEVPITVTGHTDTSNRRSFEEQLSLARANAVRDWLATHGYRGPVQTRGVAYDEPAVANPSTDQEHAANRRVTITTTPSRS